jgi:hypothetical protein
LKKKILRFFFLAILFCFGAESNQSICSSNQTKVVAKKRKKRKA